MKRQFVAGLAAAALAAGMSGCSTAVKTSPGLAALAAGDDARAYMLLQSENAAGTPGLYAEWKTFFGTTLSAGMGQTAQSVPEPSTLLMIACAALAMRRRIRR